MAKEEEAVAGTGREVMGQWDRVPEQNGMLGEGGIQHFVLLWQNGIPKLICKTNFSVPSILFSISGVQNR